MIIDHTYECSRDNNMYLWLKVQRNGGINHAKRALGLGVYTKISTAIMSGVFSGSAGFGIKYV